MQVKTSYSFYEGTAKHIYFVAETKGDISMELRDIEKHARIVPVSISVPSAVIT